MVETTLLIGSTRQIVWAPPCVLHGSEVIRRLRGTQLQRNHYKTSGRHISRRHQRRFFLQSSTSVMRLRSRMNFPSLYRCDSTCALSCIEDDEEEAGRRKQTVKGSHARQLLKATMITKWRNTTGQPAHVAAMRESYSRISSRQSYHI